MGRRSSEYSSLPGSSRIGKPAGVSGEWVEFEGGDFYRIANYDRLRPFFMTVVSDADHWLFVSSNGGLTAGRRDASLALFPYYTDDRIRDMAEVTGSKTIVRARVAGRLRLWEPFSIRTAGAWRIERHLYKNFWGNQLVFEEVNTDLGLVFRYGWFNSRDFGFVRRAWLLNSGRAAARVELLDGIQNIMPTGTGSQFNLEYSTLLDAYKKSELCAPSSLGLFRLSAIPVDRAEPAEALRTTVAWSLGLRRRLTLLSSVQLDRFRAGQVLEPETDVRAEPGAYFMQASLSLPRGRAAEWMIVADVDQGPSDVARLNDWLRRPAALRRAVLADVSRGTRELRRTVGSADGLQLSARKLASARHYGNTLFNIMRGGVFPAGYQVDRADLLSFVRNASRLVAGRHAAALRRLPRRTTLARVLSGAVATGDPHLERICREYLPLTFSRRHGDPSRPWNKFSIATRNPDGTPRLDYQGNWRDIFQNWEALALSFPAYTLGMICRFLNASTADGYNPYRITRSGIDWEVADPHDPWSYIGYWGDHQIIYLLKLLEQQEAHDPAALRRLLTREIFAYANVPYRIKPYPDLVADPKDTVVFDHALQKLIQQRVARTGADGKLVWDPDGRVRLVNLAEKLLVPLLVKLSNFVPGAGIWLNTQRPEWNDANNALVGNGTSMVTLYYLRRYLTFCRDLFRASGHKQFALSAGVNRLLQNITATLRKHQPMLAGAINDEQRRRVMDELGRAGAHHRRKVYAGLSSKSQPVANQRLLDLFDTALAWVDRSIRSNRRPDGLYHAYNLIRFEGSRSVRVRRLYEMLEGQVAVLSSGRLSPDESLKLLAALRRSRMYRPDQHSYLLYPDRELPRFVEKNNLPEREVRRSALLRRLLSDGNRRLVERDVAGRVHFHPAITNARDVRGILDGFSGTSYSALARRDAKRVLEIFERLFDHQSFTGRSGTFFGYEGLGCIYWHMVSKLLLAVQETFFRAAASGEPPRILKQLAGCYFDIRAGIGDSKTPGSYGAFPMDPYSHTPGQGGARQPGLTGQVKEDVLCRFGELGVSVVNGRIHFAPRLLRREEFLSRAGVFAYFDLLGVERRLPLKAGELAFTFCQVPVVYRLCPPRSLTWVMANGSKHQSAALQLDVDTSRLIFERTGKVRQITVSISEGKAGR